MQGAAKKRVLIFDDEADIRRMFSLVLTSQGYDVQAFEDPSVYYDAEKGGCPCSADVACADFILSDVRMLRMDGIHFMQMLQRCRCRVPARALMSGFWSPPTLKIAHELGCQTFAKPMKIDAILKWMSSC